MHFEKSHFAGGLAEDVGLVRGAAAGDPVLPLAGLLPRPAALPGLPRSSFPLLLPSSEAMRRASQRWSTGKRGGDVRRRAGLVAAEADGAELARPGPGRPGMPLPPLVHGRAGGRPLQDLRSRGLPLPPHDHSFSADETKTVLLTIV